MLKNTNNFEDDHFCVFLGTEKHKNHSNSSQLEFKIN